VWGEGVKLWIVWGGFNSGARGNIERHLGSGNLALSLIIIQYNYFISIKI
jgi:hypothetical protein